MSLKSLMNQTASYGITTIITRFINYFLTPYFTYLFTESMYGVMSYYYSIVPFGLALLSFGLESGYFRFCRKAQNSADKERLFNTLLSFLIIVSTLFFTVILICSPKIFELLGQQRGGNIYIIPIVGAIIAVDAITSIQFAQLRERADVGRFMKIKIVGVVTNFALCIGFYSLLPYIESKGINCTLWNENFGVGYVFVSNLCASLIAMIMLSKRCSNFRFKVDKKVLKAVMVFSIPIFIGGLAGTSNDFIDRQLLYFILPEGEATQQMGIYSAVMKLGAFIYLFTQMYRYAAEPYFLSEVKESDFLQRNAEALKYFTIASLAIFLFITLFIDYFQYFIGEDFRSGIKITPIILITNVLFGVYINLSYWYKIKEKSMIAIYISLSGLIVTIILNIILVPKFGYVGSAIGRLACFLTMVIIGYILNQKYMKTPYDIKSLAKYFMLTILLLALFNILNFEGLVVKTMFSIIFFAIFVAYFSYQESIFKRLKRKQ